ncbi:hypothetical protein ACS0TY_016757 [Phlomoides rotata]
MERTSVEVFRGNANFQGRDSRSFFFRIFLDTCGLNIPKAKFSEIKSIEETLEKLNRLWIDSYKLCVYLPKVERNHSVGLIQARTSFKANLSVRSPGRAYKEAIFGPTTKVQSVKPKEDSFSFTPSDEERDWLAGCWLGLLKDEFSWEDNGEKIQGECEVKIKLCYMGDNVVLIRNMSELSLEDLA